MRTSQIGLIIGTLLGMTLVIEGFGDMLIVALAALVGWIVTRVMEGELDLTDYLGGGRRRGAGR